MEKIASSIIFLGTGTGSYVVGKNLRAAGGIIIQIDDYQFHIDPGPGALVQAALCNVNLRATTALLVSHNHMYHCNDLNAVIDAMTYSGFDKNGILIANNTVINGSETEKPILIDRYKNFLERYLVIEPDKKVGIDNIEITALRTKHSEKALGFKFITPQFSLVYSSDTKYSKEIIDSYKNSNILILNMPYSEKDSLGESLNLCTEDAIRIIREVMPRLAIITHFGVGMIKADPMQAARDIQRETNIQIIAAKDGIVINPVSYSVNIGQKTLTTFSKKEKGFSEKKEFKEVDTEEEELIKKEEERKNKQEKESQKIEETPKEKTLSEIFSEQEINPER